MSKTGFQKSLLLSLFGLQDFDGYAAGVTQGTGLVHRDPDSPHSGVEQAGIGQPRGEGFNQEKASLAGNPTDIVFDLLVI